MPSMWETEMESKEPVQEERHSHQDSSRLSGGDGIKKTISTILAIAGSIAFLLLFVGGVRMSGLASQSGNTVAEYYYRAMGTCMIGFSFVAAGLLWGLSWMVAAWPDNQGIIGALARNDSSGPSNLASPRPGESMRPAATGERPNAPSASEVQLPHPDLEETGVRLFPPSVEENRQAQPSFYDSLATVDPTAPAVVRRLLSWFKGRVDVTVWGSGPLDESVTVYVLRHGARIPVCTVWSNGKIEMHFESLNMGDQPDTTRVRQLKRAIQTVSGTVFAEDAPFEQIAMQVSEERSIEGFSSLTTMLQELIDCLEDA